MIDYQGKQSAGRQEVEDVLEDRDTRGGKLSTGSIASWQQNVLTRMLFKQRGCGSGQS